MSAFDLYIWASPRDVDADRADEMLRAWEASGADPAASPFEASTDIGWFHRELMNDRPALEVVSDAVPSTSRTPVWLSAQDEPPARLVAIRLRADTTGADVDDVFSLAVKYDLVLFDARNRRVHLPNEEMAAYASATFWPRGAIQAAVAGGIGGLAAIGAWILSIPIVSGVVVVAGGFMFVMAVYSFVHEGRNALRSSRDR